MLVITILYIELSTTLNMNGSHNGISDDDFSPISEFYRGKTVFLTGVTGFLGQCFLVKLLRIGVKSVYILIRERKGKSPQERFQKLMQKPIFEPLRKERPNFADDIITVNGSLDLIELNISKVDQMILFKNVQIIIHSAADIRFDVPLNVVAMRNVRGTRELLLLARKMENFQNFIHISTAYAFCFRSTIGEEFYEPPIDGEAIIRIAENATSDEDLSILNAICDKMVTPWPNTYTFSKAITENLVKQYRKYFKITIVRPSIVTATYREPIEGWNTNFAGVNGILAGVCTGVLRSLKIKKDIAVDMVCCDFVINAALAAAYEVVSGSDALTPIYNVISSNDFIVTIDRLIKALISYRSEILPLTALWYPLSFPTENYFVYYIYNIFLHVIPAIVVDTFFKISGKKFSILQIYRQVQAFGDVLHLFLTNSFNFENNNMKRICKNMTSKDKQIFPCDFRSFNWNEYLYIYLYYGIVKSLLGEIPDREKMRNNARKLRMLHYGCMVLLGLCMVLVVWSLTNIFLK